MGKMNQPTINVPVTQRLAEFSANLRCADIPEAVVDRAQVLLSDIVGIGIRARFDADSTASVIGAAERLGLAHGQCTVFGDAPRYSPAGAALVNGTLAHSLDFDDTHAAASLHSSAPIVPAALACAELVGASGEQVLAAVIAGFEVQIRLSLALVPSDHYQRGFHPTATCGAFGAAAAAGNILGLSSEQIASAFGAVGSQTAGSMQFLANGSWNKRYHVGHAAMCGLNSAILAEQGYVGSSEAIEGHRGFLHAYAPSPDPARAVAGLGSNWETLHLAVKPYPSCRATHAAIDAVIALCAEQQLDWQRIDKMTIGLADTGWRLVGESQSKKQRPANVVDGQFSMPFCAAVAAREGRLVWDDYAKHIRDRETLALCQRVETVVDPRAQAHYPQNLSATLSVQAGGDTFESMVIVPKGEPDNFVSPDEVRHKFMALVSPYVAEANARTLFESLLNFKEVVDVGDTLALGLSPLHASSSPSR